MSNPETLAIKFQCEYCAYPDVNAEGKYWRCSQCGSEEYEATT